MERGTQIMGTDIRPELSSKNKYWLDRHRYYELKHFCLQYPAWVKARAALSGLSTRPTDLALFNRTNQKKDPTARCAEARAFYTERITMVEQAAHDTDSGLSTYILRAVTEGLSYDILKVQLNIPCSKDTYYDRYRRFFWLLNKARE